MNPGLSSIPRPRVPLTRWQRIEGPTWLLAAAIYGGWGLATWHYQALPWWAAWPLGAWLVAWHNSFQHEALHGHPTRRTWFNTALAVPPLGLWMPYPIYRDRHIEHHGVERITDPVADPESFYVDARRWRRMGAVPRALLTFNNTLLGRLTVGPAIAMVLFWRDELRRLTGGDTRDLGAWLGHGLAVAAVLYWVLAVCDIPLAAYVLSFAYPGLSLTLLRSYAEHRPQERPDHCTAIVEGGRLARLLFLNNNLHLVHHTWPGIPWYALPAVYRATRRTMRAGNGGYVFSGYGDVARRFLLRPKDLPVHPS